jgi:two-component system, chemotaxis family, chemotaxis protein CheY
MKSLIVEDNLTEQRLLEVLLRPIGDCDIARDGQKALASYAAAVFSGKPYDLICLDINMPNGDGFGVLEAIRDQEMKRGVLLGEGVKIIMTTTLADSPNVMHAFRDQCDGYLVKPVSRKRLFEQLMRLNLLRLCTPGTRR